MNSVNQQQLPTYKYEGARKATISASPTPPPPRQTLPNTSFMQHEKIDKNNLFVNTCNKDTTLPWADTSITYRQAFKRGVFFEREHDNESERAVGEREPCGRIASTYACGILYSISLKLRPWEQTLIPYPYVYEWISVCTYAQREILADLDILYTDACVKVQWAHYKLMLGHDFYSS